MKKTIEADLLERATIEAAQASTWADLSNFLFDDENGIVAKAFSTRKQREAFMATPEYKAIRKLIEEKQNETGFIEGATPTKSGKFVVRLPRSLHAALEIEAKREGVSLNQLVVAKLAVPMSGLFTKPTA